MCLITQRGNVVTDTADTLTLQMSQHAQSGLENSKNSNTLKDILDQDIDYFDSINRSLAPDVLVQLSHVLLHQREQLKVDRNKVLDKMSDLEAELQHERTQVSEMREHAKVLEEECQNLRNIMTMKEHENQMRINQINETSTSMLEEVTEELKKERETNQELKSLLKEIKAKDLEIRKLTISINKLTEQNQSLRQLKNFNALLRQQLNDTELKLAESRQAHQKQNEENQQLRSKVAVLQEKVQELQYIAINQMVKVKEVMSQDIGKREIKSPDTRQKQNAELLKEVENNFDTDFFADQINENQRRWTKEKGNQNGEHDFQSSLDIVSENWDKISLREIQASSKSKTFGDNIFGSDERDRVRGFQSAKRAAITDKTKGNKQKEEDSGPDFPLPLSITRKQGHLRKESEPYITASKHKGSLPVHSAHAQEEGASRASRSQKQDHQIQGDEFFTPQADFALQIRKRTKTNTEFKTIRGNQWQQLNQKLQKYKKTNKELQQKLQQAQKKLQQQINAFQQQAYFQISTIERLTNQLKQQKLLNMQQIKKRDQRYNEDVLAVSGMCQDLETQVESLSRTAQKERTAAQELTKRLMEVEEEKWQQRQSCIVEKGQFGQQVEALFGRFKINEVLGFNFSGSIKVQKQINTDPTILIEEATQTIQKWSKNRAIAISIPSTIPKLSKAKPIGLSIPSVIPKKQQKQTQISPPPLPATKSLSIGQSRLISITTTDKNTSPIKIPFKITTSFAQHFEPKNKNETPPPQTYPTIKLMTRKKKSKEEEPIKEFKPTPIAEQRLEDQYAYDDVRQNERQKQNDKTVYYSFDQQPENPAPNTRQTTVQLLKLNIILTNLKKNHHNSSKMPNLTTVKLTTRYKFPQLVKKYRNNTKQYFLLSALYHSPTGLVTDRLLLWREGLISAHLGTGIAMTGTKKYIYDPENFVMGNCEVVLDRAGQTVEVRRDGKRNYMIGEMGDGGWRVLAVEAYGDY